jgi:hypothetical protein
MANQLQLDPYNEEICKKIVEFFKEEIKNKYGRFTLNDFYKFHQTDNLQSSYRMVSPRCQTVTGIIPCASFYYLNKLLEIQPSKIADIGCGMNFFKDIIPGIIGFDGSGEERDVNEYFDDNFITKHTNFFQCAFSINALHYIPITSFYERVMDFTNIIKSGGRGYLSMNVARMVDNTDKKILKELFDTDAPDTGKLSDYVNQKIKTLPLKFLIIDNLIAEIYDEYLDGNIRLVFEK